MSPTLIALVMYVTGGSPYDVDGPDHEAGCYLGTYTGGERRVVYDGPEEAPFFTGSLGAVERAGMVRVAQGVHDGVDVTVHLAQVYEVTARCEIAASEGPMATEMVLPVGARYTLRAEACDDDGFCEASSGGENFLMIPGTCQSREVPVKASGGQLGWWIPVHRGEERGWVRGDVGFHLESRCVGPAGQLTAWRRLS